MKKLLIPALFLVFSCQSGSKATSEDVSNGVISLDSLKSEVLFIHDEVMPKMGELRRVRKDLMLQADSLMASDASRASILDSLANNIASANEGMMQWMRGYEPDFEGTEEEVRAYLEAQKSSIQKVKEDMESALKSGMANVNQE